MESISQVLDLTDNSVMAILFIMTGIALVGAVIMNVWGKNDRKRVFDADSKHSGADRDNKK